MTKHKWCCIGEELEFVERLVWCPHCGTVRLASRHQRGPDGPVCFYWYKGMDLTEGVPEEEPPCNR